MKIYKISAKRAEKIVTNAMSAAWLLWIRTASWGNRRQLAQELLEEKFKEDAKAIRATQILIDSDAVKRVISPMRKAQNKASNMSEPWFHKGIYFVQDKDRAALEDIMRETKVEVLKLRKKLKEEYPALKVETKKKHPNIYREEYYPTPSELEQRFGFIWGWQNIGQPFPELPTDKTDRRIAERENEKFVELFKGNVEEWIAASRKAYLEILQHLRDVLKDPEKKFQDTTVEKPREFLKEMANSINLFGDVPFEKLSKDIEEIMDGVDPQELRDDVSYRRDMADVLDDVVDVFEELPTVKLERALDF